jgi:signal peptidase II
MMAKVKSLTTPVAFVIIAALVVFDQAIKALVESTMELGEAIAVLPFFAILRAHNDGVAFSMFGGVSHTSLIIITSLISLGALIYLIKTPPQDWTLRLGLALIVGGAIGNIIDRIQHAYVIDYFYFHTPVWSFAIFNLADVFISCGAVLILVTEILLKPSRQTS